MLLSERLIVSATNPELLKQSIAAGIAQAIVHI
jgi:hypothetical protein